MGYKEATLTFHDDKITYVGNPAEGMPNYEEAYPGLENEELEVMMSWEAPIMEKSAEFVCQNGGDILEIGFGMGIASDYIQAHNPTSHTIIEMHPQIAERARAWASDKPNVTIIEGDWIKEIDSLGNFDGIFFDTWGFFGHWGDLANKTSEHANSGCHITFWNCLSKEANGCGFNESHNITYEQISVDPPQNTYFNHETYYMPKVVV